MAAPWCLYGLMRFDDIIYSNTSRIQTYVFLGPPGAVFPARAPSFNGYLQIRHIAISLTEDLVFDQPTKFESLLYV